MARVTVECKIYFRASTSYKSIIKAREAENYFIPELPNPLSFLFVSPNSVTSSIFTIVIGWINPVVF